jgi:hypothetical protein
VAVSAGGRITTEAAQAEHGYTGHMADPDGFLWELTNAGKRFCCAIEQDYTIDSRSRRSTRGGGSATLLIMETLQSTPWMMW